MSLKRLFTWGRKRKESLPLGTVKEESERADSRLENLKEREAALSRTTLTLNRKESRTDGRLTRNESRNEGRMIRNDSRDEGRMMRNDSRDEGRMMRNDSRDEGRMMRNDSRDEGHDDYGMAGKRADAAVRLERCILIRAKERCSTHQA
ncbi:hypothetical protein BT69DRAFT_881128 [Atractiella rhizophila]|nr:hypothetical protein BT69DRAFT_881128 [Atractiella rhizophila]